MDQRKEDFEQGPEAFGWYAEDPIPSKEEALDDLQAMGETIAGTLPIAGDAIDARDFAIAAEKGDKTGMAMAGLGFVPFVGGALRKGAEITLDLFKGADKPIQEAAIRITSENLGRIPNPDNAEDVRQLVLNARDVERKLILQHSAETRPDIPQGGNEPVSFGRNKRDVYHGVKEEKRDFVEEEGIVPSPHAELGTETVSTSSDPIYSARHFADSDVEGLYEGRIPEDTNIINMDPATYEMQRDRSINIQENIDETTATLKPEVADIYGMDPDTPITMDEMEMWGIPEEDLNFKDGEPFAAKVPKVSAFNSEAETIVGDPDSLNFMKITENPEKAEFIKQGIKEANQVFEDQQTIIDFLWDLPIEITPKQAKGMYMAIRDNLKKGAALAKYTEDNSARGTYDWYVANWAKKVPATDLQRVADSLVGEQNKANMQEFINTIDKFRVAAGPSAVHNAADPVIGRAMSDAGKVGGQNRKQVIDQALEQYEMGIIDQATFEAQVKEATQAAKKGMMPLTDKFAKGGLVS